MFHSPLFARSHRASGWLVVAAFIVALVAPISGAQAGPARLYVSPHGFQVEILPGFTRDRAVQPNPNIEAAWNGPRRAKMAMGTGPIPASISGPQLLQMAKAAYPRFYGKAGRIVHAETITANGNRGVVIEGRSMSTLKPIIAVHSIQFSLARGTKLYVFSLAVPANEADAAGTRFTEMLKTLRFR